MVIVDKDWSHLEEGLQRALRERDALVAQALTVAAARSGGGLVKRLDALEGEAQTLARAIAEQAQRVALQAPLRDRARQAARTRARWTQVLVGLFGLAPAGVVLALGLLGMLCMAPYELLALFFTEGRELGRFMGWPLIAAGLGLAVLVASLLWILLLSSAPAPGEDEAGAVLRRQTNRLSAVRAELGRVRGQVDALLASDVQALLPPGAPDVDVVALWLQRLGERRGEPPSSESPPGLDDLGRVLEPALPRGVLALRAVTVAPEARIDLILIGRGSVWLLQVRDLPGAWVQVYGAWTRRESGARRAATAGVDAGVIEVDALVRATRAVSAALHAVARPGPIRVQCGVVFTHPDVDLRGYGATPIDYGTVDWWVDRLARDLGPRDRGPWPPDRLQFLIVDTVLGVQAGLLGLDRFPATGAASAIFEEQWVAIEGWNGHPSPGGEEHRT